MTPNANDQLNMSVYKSIKSWLSKAKKSCHKALENGTGVVVGNVIRVYDLTKKLTINKRRWIRLSELVDSDNLRELELELTKVSDNNCKIKLNQLLTQYPSHDPKATSLVVVECIKHRNHRLLAQIVNQQLVNIDVPLDQYEWTAFHRAAYHKDMDLVKTLIKLGARIDVADCNGNTPLHVLIQSRSVRATLLASDYSVGNSRAIVELMKTMVEYSQKCRVNLLNQANHFGKTVLHYAVMTASSPPPVDDGQIDVPIVDYLISCGADVNCSDKNRKTPLYCNVVEDPPSLKQRLILARLLKADCDQLDLVMSRGFLKQLFNGQVPEKLLVMPSLKQIARSKLERIGWEADGRTRSELPDELREYLSRRMINGGTMLNLE